LFVKRLHITAHSIAAGHTNVKQIAAYGYNTEKKPMTLTSIKPQKDSHCSYCGHTFSADQPWPRRCGQCGSTSYRNPLPVAVVLVPVGDGLLVVRRSIPPQQGELALPGGFITTGESWQEAGAREVSEETGLTIDPADVHLFDVHSAPDGTVLIFGLVLPRTAEEMPPFAPNSEGQRNHADHRGDAACFPTPYAGRRTFLRGESRSCRLTREPCVDIIPGNALPPHHP
jgi:ADP-ribose pyrophosphatase YjhB (NUDIX family)